MNAHFAEPPPHTEVINPLSYAIIGALGPRLIQLKHAPDVVSPTFPGKDEVADSSSLPHHPGIAEQPYSPYVAAEYPFVPNQILVAYAPTYGTNVNHSECYNEIQHHSNTPYAPSSNIMAVTTRLAKVGDETFQTNPSAGPKEKLRTDEYANCPPKQCRYPGPDGKCCLQEVTYATVADHFITHGLTNKSRSVVIPCQWEGCSTEVARHNFIRHIRERHLGYKRKLKVSRSAIVQS